MLHRSLGFSWLWFVYSETLVSLRGVAWEEFLTNLEQGVSCAMVLGGGHGAIQRPLIEGPCRA